MPSATDEAHGDPEIRVLWPVFEEQCMANHWLVAERLAAKGVLKPGMDADEDRRFLGYSTTPPCTTLPSSSAGGRRNGGSSHSPMPSSGRCEHSVVRAISQSVGN